MKAKHKIRHTQIHNNYNFMVVFHKKRSKTEHLSIQNFMRKFVDPFIDDYKWL